MTAKPSGTVVFLGAGAYALMFSKFEHLEGGLEQLVGLAYLEEVSTVTR